MFVVQRFSPTPDAAGFAPRMRPLTDTVGPYLLRQNGLPRLATTPESAFMVQRTGAVDDDNRIERFALSGADCDHANGRRPRDPVPCRGTAIDASDDRVE
jgi:hypothetical protein